MATHFISVHDLLLICEDLEEQTVSRSVTPQHDIHDLFKQPSRRMSLALTDLKLRLSHT